MPMTKMRRPSKSEDLETPWRVAPSDHLAFVTPLRLIRASTPHFPRDKFCVVTSPHQVWRDLYEVKEAGKETD